MHKSIIIIAGEPSADMHGASLALQLKNLKPDLRIFGVGGDKMREAGVQTFADLSRYAVIGFIEVLKHLSIYKKTFRITLEQIKKIKPQAVVLIDFPGFNLRLAKQIKKDMPAVKVIYYISPQIWAWGKKRIKLIRKIVDKMIVVFKFEETLYKDNGIDAEFVGHPLLEKFKGLRDKTELSKTTHFSKDDKILALMPGSRVGEVKKILPLMLSSANLLKKEMPEVEFLLIRAANIDHALINQLLQNYPHLTVKIIDRQTYDALKVCSFAWVCSGTATLETAILGIPMLIVYKTSFFTWLISKILIRLPYIGLVNVVAEKQIMPEFIQYQATSRNLAVASIDFFLSSEQHKKDLREELHKVREKLGTSDAAQNTANLILKVISS